MQYGCIMDTETHNAVAAQLNAYATAIDFDTRLTLAGAGMDAVLAHNHGVTLDEAHRAVQESLFDPSGLPDVEPQFQPHPVLKAAGDVIRARGWIKDSYGHATGPVCAMAAIRTVLYGDGWFHVSTDSREEGPVEELLNRIAVEFGEPWSIPNWNDRQVDVKDVLRLLY